jgi:hypothetical protein
MGRTMLSNERKSNMDYGNMKKNRKSMSKKKNRNISKWGKESSNVLEMTVDRFQIQSPEHSSNDSNNDYDLVWWE